jgi:hypothetical protein
MLIRPILLNSWNIKYFFDFLKYYLTFFKILQVNKNYLQIILIELKMLKFWRIFLLNYLIFLN